MVRRRELRRVRYAVLALVGVLVAVGPATYLYLEARFAAGETSAAAGQELLGVDFLGALRPLTSALVDAQTAAVAGQAVDENELESAISTVDAADSRAGTALGLHDRWSLLRTRIHWAAATGATPRERYDAYVEATDLLLAMYAKVPLSSLLGADPAADAAGLRDAAVIDLPRITVSAGRYADLVRLGAGSTPTGQRQLELVTERQQVLSAGAELVDRMQAVVAATSSSTLSGAVLSELDGVRLQLEALARPVDDRGALTKSTVDAAVAVRGTLLPAASALSTKVLNGLADLVTTRRTAADTVLSRAAGAGLALIGLAVVVVVAVVLPVVRGRHRTDPAASGPSRHARVEPDPTERALVGAGRGERSGASR